MNERLRDDQAYKMPTRHTPKSEHKKGSHMRREQRIGDISENLMALIHKAIPIDQAYKIDDAAKAVEAEWLKLEKIKSWDVDLVQDKRDVVKRARKDKISVHFGSLRPLCHQKNSEQSVELRSYKGRVIFRGDIVRDEDGGQGDGVPKACHQQAAADPQGSRTRMCAITYCFGGWHVRGVNHESSWCRGTV